jgi:hypothetical protein
MSGEAEINSEDEGLMNGRQAEIALIVVVSWRAG